MNLLVKTVFLIYCLQNVTTNSVKKLGPCTAQLDDGSIIDLSKLETF